MTLYVRTIDNRVVGLNDQDGYDATHDSVQGLWERVPDDADPQPVLFATRNPDGSYELPAPSLPALTPMQFYLAFTPAERIAIKTSADPVVQEFWATYEIALQTNTPIDIGLASVTGGLDYIATTDRQPATTPPSTYIAAARIPHILAGEAQ